MRAGSPGVRPGSEFVQCLLVSCISRRLPTARSRQGGGCFCILVTWPLASRGSGAAAAVGLARPAVRAAGLALIWGCRAALPRERERPSWAASNRAALAVLCRHRKAGACRRGGPNSGPPPGRKPRAVGGRRGLGPRVGQEAVLPAGDNQSARIGGPRAPCRLPPHTGAPRSRKGGRPHTQTRGVKGDPRRGRAPGRRPGRAPGRGSWPARGPPTAASRAAARSHTAWAAAAGAHGRPASE